MLIMVQVCPNGYLDIEKFVWAVAYLSLEIDHTESPYSNQKEIPKLTRVCAGCWRTANREVQRQRLHDSGRPLAQIDDTPNEPHIPLPPPLPIPHQLPIPHIRTAVAKIQSSVYKRTAASSSVCLFMGCQRPEHLLVPKQIKDMLLIHKKFYVPNSARICHHHLQNGNWMDLTSNLHDFTGVQFDIILKTLEKAAEYHLDFNNISTMAPSLCHYWLGMSYEQFDELLARVPSLSQSVKNYHLALCIYIVKLRTGDRADNTILHTFPNPEKERFLAWDRSSWK
ncbi:hypothetical protein ACJJTC_002416 [Scirpophaga incertulas]